MPSERIDAWTPRPPDGPSTLSELSTYFKGRLGVPTVVALVLFAVSPVVLAVTLDVALTVWLLAIAGVATVVSAGGVLVRARREMDRKVSSRTDRTQAEIAKLRASTSKSLQALEGKMTALESAISDVGADLSGRLGELEEQVQDDLGVVNEVLKESSERFASWVTTQERLQIEVAQIRDQLEAVQKGSRTFSDSLESLKVRLDEVARSHVGRIEAVEANLDGKLSADDVEDLLPDGAPIANVAGYQPFARKATDVALRSLEEDWARRLGLQIDGRELSYLAHRLGELEVRCLGRLATSIDSVLLRVMVVRSALRLARESARPLRVLEVGSLFGVGLGALYESCRDRGVRVCLTAIDPLDGYYGNDRPDIITGVPITKDVFVENLQRMNVPEDDWELHCGVSEEVLPLLRSRNERFDCVIVDGDHSYQGVKTDVEGALPLITAGGFLIIDDYGSSSWPDVVRYVDEEAVANPQLQLVGMQFDVAVFRRVQDVDGS